MTKIDIISGFLGAGKTTLIKKLLSEAFTGEQVVLIENEFGEIGIDGGFLKESGIEIREMNSGCICCSLVGDFGKSLREVVDTYHPDRILIEPSGVGKLSDVIKAVQDVQNEIDAELNSFTTVVDVTKCRIYRKNFGEFFSNQIEYAGAVILSRTDKAKPEKIEESVALLRELNDKAPFVTTPIAQLPGEKILLRGNHDYWWTSLKKMQQFTENRFQFLQNNCLMAGKTAICGTRGWILPSSDNFTPEDEKIYQRESIRLELSLQAAAKQQAENIICVFHYPPLFSAEEHTLFTDLLEKYNVSHCVYGHIHGENHISVYEGQRTGINYKLVSCDTQQFQLYKIL